MPNPIVVVGAGQAAASFVAKLRSSDQNTPVIVIGDEPHLPYQRPPLSKKYLLGELELPRLQLRPQSWYEDHTISLRLGTQVTQLDAASKTLTLDAGETLSYHKLLLATGATPRQLPEQVGGTLRGVYTIRNLADVDQMKTEFSKGKQLVIVGGGYIGLEAAAVAADLGLQVTVIELADRILQRVAAPETSDYFRALHQANGVTILEATGLEKILGENGKVTGVSLTDGTELPADFVIAGIGVTPNIQLAEQAGLTIDDGIAVNLNCQTSDPDIYASGDCASFEYLGQRIRLESVQNAVDQSEHAAAHILGDDTDYQPVPWFWSDQYRTKLQIAGLNLGYTDTITRPGKREGALSVWYYQHDQLLAVDAMNDPIAYTMGRKILAAGKNIPKQEASNPAVNLKDFV